MHSEASIRLLKTRTVLGWTAGLRRVPTWSEGMEDRLGGGGR